jgi:hypothetical protein
MFLSYSRPSKTGCDPHIGAHVHLALHFLDDIGRDYPDHPLILRGHDLCNLRGLDAAGAHRHPSRTDVRCEHQLARRLALFPVSPKPRQHIEDNLDRILNRNSSGGTGEVPFFICGPPQRKQHPPSAPVPPVLTCTEPPKPPFPMVVSWSTKWVYFVRPRLPKFFTCITCGRRETSIVDSVASVKSCRLRIS